MGVEDVNDPGGNNHADIFGTISCDYDMRICARSQGGGKFKVFAEKSNGVPCDAVDSNNLGVPGLYSTSNIQSEVLFLGCGLSLKFPIASNAALPEAGDQWSIPITPGSPVYVTGVDFAWTYKEMGDDKGDPAVWWQNITTANIPATSPPGPYNTDGYPLPYDFPAHLGIIAPAPQHNEYQYFLASSPTILNYNILTDPPNKAVDPAGALNDWFPFTGFRRAQIQANITTLPDIKGSADFYVGDFCEEKYKTKTLYDIYPLVQDVNSMFILHFDDSMKADTKKGLVDPVINNGVTFEGGLSDGTNTLGKSARWSNSGQLKYNTKDNFNPQKGTISFWFNQQSLPTAAAVVGYYFNIQNDLGTTLLFRITVDDTGNIVFSYLGNNATGSVSQSIIPAAVGQWHYLVATWNAVPDAADPDKFDISTEIYVDGVRGNEISQMPGSDLVNSTSMSIGSRFDSAKPIDANIDEFEIRQDNLTADEIQKRFMAERRCLGNSNATAPNVISCQPSDNPPACADVAAMKCLNPEISAQFDIDMDSKSILQKSLSGNFQNILVYEDVVGVIPSPEVSLVTGLSYNATGKTAYVTGLKPASDSLDTGLVLKMEFDTTSFLNDTSGNDNHASCSGCPEWEGGAFPDPLHTAKFNGIDEYLKIPDNPTLDITGQMTLSAWVNPASFDRKNNIICKGDGNPGNEYNYCLYLEPNTGNITMASGDGSIVSIPVAPALNAWTHIVVINTGENYVFYVNGAATIVGTPAKLLKDNNYPLYIGYNNFASPQEQHFKGNLDEVRVWRRALSDSEVLRVFQNKEDKSLILNMNFDDKNNPTKDLSGREHNGACSGAVCPIWTTSGRYGAALNFDGKDDYVKVSSFRMDYNFSYSLWVNWVDDAVAGNLWDPLISRAAVKANGFGLLISPSGVNGGKLFSYLGGGDPADPDFFVMTDDKVIPGEWTFVTVTVNQAANKNCIYINGKESKCGVLIAQGIFDNSITIGASLRPEAWANEYFKGAIDEVKMWSKALTADDIKKLYYNSAFLPGKTYGVRVVGGAGGVTSDVGVPMTANEDWKITIDPNAKLCSCDHVKVTVQTGEAPNDKYAVKYNDLFTCAGNSCADDTNGLVAPSNGNQHIYTAQCQDTSWGIPINVLSDYVWTQDDPQKLFTWPNNLTTPSIIVTNTSVNGEATVSIKATGNLAGGARGEDERSMVLLNFVCNNPWPSFDNLYFNDAAPATGGEGGAAGPYTNFKFFYCKDKAGTPSAVDDLPGLDIGIPPKVE